MIFICLIPFGLNLDEQAKDKLEKSMVADNESGKSIESEVRTSSGMFLKKAQVSEKSYSKIFLFLILIPVLTIFPDLYGYTLTWVACVLYYNQIFGFL